MSVKLPVGEYYIGDPCYVIAGENWISFLEENDFCRQPDGEITFRNIDGFATSCYYGDGAYYAAVKDVGNDVRFDVDSGLLGCIPIGMIDSLDKVRKDVGESGKFITFAESFYCAENEGKFVFGNNIVVIDTNFPDDDYSY